MTVAAGCLPPGATQTVTVRSRAGLQVTVDPRYSDGATGSAYGGEAVAQTIAADGTFHETWTVSSRAPLGEVVVEAGVAAPSGPRVSGSASTRFLLAAHC